MNSFNHFNFKSGIDGLEISCLKLAPEGRPKGILQLAHGMCEHKERYRPFMEYASDRGYVAVINDHRGHGESLDGGQTGYFGRGGAAALVEDMHALTRVVKEQYPGVPLVMLGHSMGSLAARAYRALYEEELSGLIVCGSPGRNPAAGAGLLLLKAMARIKGEKYKSKFAENLVTGSFSRKFREEGTKSAWICSDADVVGEYDSDPMCGFTFTINGYTSLLELMRRAYEVTPARCPELPVRFISGEDDPCMGGRRGFDNALRRMRECGLKDVEGRIYPGMRHEILKEKGKARVFADICDWLDIWTCKQ